MNIKDEDFERFLKANFSNDWRRFTSSDATEDVKFSIMSNHQKTYKIFKQFSDLGMLINDCLPPELMNGQLTTDEYFARMQEYLNQPIIYDNNNMIAVRMKYGADLPNMVYTIDPIKCISQKIDHAHKIGLKGQTFERNIQGEADSWALMAKAESLGVSEDVAKKTAETSNAIDVQFQLFEAKKRIDEATNKKAKLEAELQYNILLRDNFEHLQKEQPNTEKIIDDAFKLIKEAHQTPITNNENVAKEDAQPPAVETKNAAKEDTQTPIVETKSIAKEIAPNTTLETKKENDETLKASTFSVSQKTFTIQEKNTSHIETSIPSLFSGKQQKTPTPKENPIKTFNGVFASYATSAKDFSPEGISKALAQGYTKEDFEDFYSFSKKLNQRISSYQTSMPSTEITRNSALDRDTKLHTSPYTDRPTSSPLDKRISAYEHSITSNEPLTISALDQNIERITSLLQAEIKAEISTQIADVRKKIAQTRSEITTSSRTINQTTSRYRSSSPQKSESYLSPDFDM